MTDALIYKRDVQKLVCRLNGCVGTKRNFDNCEKRCPDFKAVDELATVKQSEEKGFQDGRAERPIAVAVKFFNDPYTGKLFTTCSRCDGKISPKDNYCKHCGAEMVEVVGNVYDNPELFRENNK